MKICSLETYGMHCPACPRLLESRLERLPGVLSAEAHIDTRTTTVVFDGLLVDEGDIARAIEGSGFSVCPRRGH